MDRREIEAENERHWRGLALPMPRLSGPLPFEEIFTVEESGRLGHHVLPEQMEDKWLVLYDETVLNFYRSWTGFHIYSVVLVTMDPDAEGPDVQYCATDATINRDPEQYTAGSDAHEAALLLWLMRTLLLHQDVPFPQDPSISPEEALLGAWAVGGYAALGSPDPDGDEDADGDQAPDEAPPPEEPPEPDAG